MMVCGGYFLTAAVDRPAYVSADLLPARLLSLSECICDFVPDLWAIEGTEVTPENRAAEARRVGVAEADLPDLMKWTTEAIGSGRLGRPCVFLSVADARAFAARFLPGVDGLRLLGIGLPAGAVEAFLADEQPGPSQEPPGIHKAVSRRAALESGGAVLGWEVLCYEYGGFHSWLCNGLETAVARALGIEPNRAGFIASADAARTAAEYCGRDEVGAEPGFWAPWLVVEYPRGGGRPSGSS